MASDRDHDLMMDGTAPHGCICELLRPPRYSYIGDPPEPAEWEINHDCELHGDES